MVLIPCKGEIFHRPRPDTSPQASHRKSTDKMTLYTGEMPQSPGCSIAFLWGEGITSRYEILAFAGLARRNDRRTTHGEADIMPADSEPSPVWLRVCAWCGIVLQEDGQPLASAAISAMTTHGICPICRDAFIGAATGERTTPQRDGPATSETA